MKLLDGKALAAELKKKLAARSEELIEAGERTPHLAAILVGDDGASETYVASKEKACKAVGFTSSIYRHSANISEQDVLELIDFLNQDDEVDGFIVQLPLPDHIDEQKVIARIDPKKDVDGFHPENIGKMVLGEDTLLPATPNGIMEILKYYEIDTVGKNCVVLGRSNIVGTPMSILMSRNNQNANSTVTLCHSRTKNLKNITAKADILIAAIGKANFITADMVKDGAVVVDVGIHRLPSTVTKSGYKLHGDVLFEEVSKKASWITPVPGGVGPMTILSLLQNTLRAFENRRK